MEVVVEGSFRVFAVGLAVCWLGSGWGLIVLTLPNCRPTVSFETTEPIALILFQISNVFFAGS